MGCSLCHCGWAAMRRVDAAEIDALLPQTQCTRCGYAGCRPYAEALASGAAALNQCPPGGAALIESLARLLGREPLPLNPVHGVEAPARIAWIDPQACIGCARCLPPCPVDAILGAQRQLHTVIPAWCTGCELCLVACPVDCIHMRAWPDAMPQPQPADNRRRHHAHEARRAAAAATREQALQQLKHRATSAADPT
ncbi:MAG: RnfABCDGE type electron transport complex subunit B [Proteobacteria bacterium]|nr:RnfABCDGE type electron transport complex subunit B [Pseudomonadota bacterium]